MSAENYERALEAFRKASREYGTQLAAYRKREISDATFLEARARFDAAQLELDKAEKAAQ